METNDQQAQIQKVQAACKDRWRSGGIPEDQIRLMSDEVEEDLQQAIKNGRAVEEVIGPDMERFARSYTTEADLHESSKDRVLVWVIVAVLFLIVAVGLALRFLPLLDSWLPWFAAVALVAVAAALLLFWPGRSR